tara:strand:+ start:4479 stop:5807 length:1329 start_codon:yes stop_codon:yes gene_type:complete
MHNIVNHHNHPSITTYPTNLTEGCVNPLRRTSYKKLININSRFRDNYTTTPASDFYFNFPEPIDNIVSMKLNRIILPKFIYTINHKTGSNNFTIYIKYENGGQHKETNNRICIQSGSYSGEQMKKILNDELKQVLPSVLQDLILVKYTPTTGKIYFEITWTSLILAGVKIDEIKFCFDYIEPCQATSKSDCSGVPCSSFLSNCCINNGNNTSNFCQNDEIYSHVGSNVYKDQLTLGWILGFRGDYKYNTPKVATTNPTIGKFFTGNLNNSQGLSRKQLRELNTIRPRRARLTEIKDNGMQYLENTYNCCDPSGRMFEPQDISFCYTLLNDSKTKTTNFGGESIYDPLGNRYFLLSINDHQNHHNRNLISPMQKETLTDGNILAKVYGACGGECCYDNEERIYFGPTNISRLNIRLLDEFGRVVDLNNGDYSFTLEVEILYDL